MTPVTALKAIKDTLWVGRSTGDILIVNIESRDTNGCIEAVLEVVPIFGPVKCILYPNPGKVVAIREVIREERVRMYPILIWEDWGSKEAKEFENALTLST